MEPFEIGVGIATGIAVVGNIGHEKRLDYTVIGDTVNLAARLEAATKELAVPTVISAPTARLLLGVDGVEFPVDLGTIRVKGKAEPVEVWGLHHHAKDDGASDLDLAA
jgi:adenylate cyclase